MRASAHEAHVHDAVRSDGLPVAVEAGLPCLAHRAAASLASEAVARIFGHVDRRHLAVGVDAHAQRDHGFVLTKEGGLLYFHRNAVLVGDFDRLKRGDAVRYVEEVGDTGPIATKVRLRSGSNGSAAQDGSA
mgnify:CR=1 FL=1